MEMPTPSSPTAAAVTVRRGDTLVSLVKAHYKGQGVSVDDRQAFLMALRVARGNNIPDATRIQPGQTVRLDALPGATELAGAGKAAAPGAAGAATASTATATTAAEVLAGRPSNPVFERTLARAVERGFIPPHEQDAVRERVARLAGDYGFDADDFARVALIESDGLNPAANNGRCHGIIQFCGGPGRGAASVGYASNPREISRMSVLQQLDLVDRYFQDVGLPRGGKVSLDELYLTVLTPAARSQRAPSAPLPVAGLQARALYEGAQRDGAITRRSITQGLQRNAVERLADVGLPTMGSVTTGFAQVASLPASPPAVPNGSNWPSQRQWLAANALEKP